MIIISIAGNKDTGSKRYNKKDNNVGSTPLFYVPHDQRVDFSNGITKWTFCNGLCHIMSRVVTSFYLLWRQNSLFDVISQCLYLSFSCTRFRFCSFYLIMCIIACILIVNANNLSIFLFQKDYLATIPTQTFDDVAGNNVAKKEMQNLVAFLTEPEKFAKMGCKIPKGVLLSGECALGKYSETDGLNGLCTDLSPGK